MAIHVPRIIKKSSTSLDVPKGHFAVYVGGEAAEDICDTDIILEPAFSSRPAKSSRGRFFISITPQFRI